MAGRTGGGRGTSTVPMNVEQIVKEAQNFEFNPTVALKQWFRSASRLLKEVGVFTPRLLNLANIYSG